MLGLAFIGAILVIALFAVGLFKTLEFLQSKKENTNDK